MSNKHKKTGTYVSTLRDFGGLDLTGASDDSTPRFSRLDNMWRDYKSEGGDAIESFPGFRRLTSLDGAVHGLWTLATDAEELLIIHAGDSLYATPFSATDETVLSTPPTCIAGSRHVLADAPSHGFSVGNTLYLLDGQGYYRLSGNTSPLTLEEVRDLYIPVTYSDGAQYEQQNLLSRYVINRFHIGSSEAYPCGTAGLAFNIIDREARTCEVSGYRTSFRTPTLYIPPEAVISGTTYRVIRVAWKAFPDCTHLTHLYVSPGVEEIDIVAFDHCSSLQEVYLPDTLLRVGRCAFRGCSALTTLVLGRGLKYIEDRAFSECTALESVSYHGDAESYSEIDIHDSNTELLSATRRYLNSYPAELARFPLYENIEEITEVTLNGEHVLTSGTPHYAVDYTDDGRIAGVILRTDDTHPLAEKLLTVKLRLAESTPSFGDETDPARVENGYDGPTHAALAHCTRAASYDGRIFFTGNPELPATVFYTSRDLDGRELPTYVGVYNYFLCGGASAPITALLPTASYLAVLTRDAHGGGNVSYYHGSDTDRNLVPRIYVRSDTIPSPGCCGIAENLRDDPVFLTKEGLEAASRTALSTERSLYHRSSLIDSALTSQDLEHALSVVWEGYLVLLFPDGNAYLADSRRTAHTRVGGEYEWYHLTGVGCYREDLPVWRYADAYRTSTPDTILWNGKTHTLCLHPDADGLAYGSGYESYADVYPRILLGVNTAGETVAFTVEHTEAGDTLFLLSGSEERTGGSFSPPTTLSALHGKLFIGCEGGELAVVNTDRRGVMNEVQAEAYSPAAYARQWGHLINPEWYSYAGHRYLAGLATLPDDCGVSNYTKGTLRGTTVLEMKAGIGPGFSIEVRLWRADTCEPGDVLHTNHGGLDFAALNFAQINFGACEDCTVTLNERSRRYLKKQYCLFSDAYARPFGLKSLSHTWQVEGKVKNA